MPQSAEKIEELPFEDAMERLESIVHEMEEDRLPLEKLLTHYEVGSRLLGVCQKRIQEARQRVEVIAARANGGAELREFDGGGEAAAGATAPAAGAPPAADGEAGDDDPFSKPTRKKAPAADAGEKPPENPIAL